YTTRFRSVPEHAQRYQQHDGDDHAQQHAQALVAHDVAVLPVLQLQLGLNAVQLGFQVGGVQLAVAGLVVVGGQVGHGFLQLLVHRAVQFIHSVPPSWSGVGPVAGIAHREPERRALAHGAVDAKGKPVLLQDRLGDGKPQSGAGAAGVPAGAVVAVKDVGQVLGRDARAVVGDLDAAAAVLRGHAQHHHAVCANVV